MSSLNSLFSRDELIKSLFEGIRPNLIVLHLRDEGSSGSLWVINIQNGSFDEEILANVDSRAFTSITSIFLESSTQNGKLLSFQVRVQLFENSLEESLLSVVIHINDSFPVAGDFE